MHSNPVEATAVAVLLVILFIAMNGGIPMPSRFSIRQLLIITTAVAAVLGIIVYAARH